MDQAREAFLRSVSSIVIVPASNFYLRTVCNYIEMKKHLSCCETGDAAERKVLFCFVLFYLEIWGESLAQCVDTCVRRFSSSLIHLTGFKVK
jgi:hypothetical protein